MGKKEVDVKDYPKPCPDCNGTGGDDTYTCPTCSGEGYLSK